MRRSRYCCNRRSASKDTTLSLSLSLTEQPIIRRIVYCSKPLVRGVRVSGNISCLTNNNCCKRLIDLDLIHLAQADSSLLKHGADGRDGPDAYDGALAPGHALAHDPGQGAEPMLGHGVLAGCSAVTDAGRRPGGYHAALLERAAQWWSWNPCHAC